MFGPRLFSGIIMIIIALATMWFGGIPLAVIVLLISLGGYLELNRALYVKGADSKKVSVPVIVGFTGIVLYDIFMYFMPKTEILLIGLVVLFMAEMFCYVFAFPKYSCEEIIFAIFSFLYAPVMLSFIYMTRASEYGFYMVWLILISSWGCDTCAYCVGKLIGKKKVFPVLSPHKSLEGCIGGCLGSALIGFIYGVLVVEKAMPEQHISIAIAIICAFGALMSMVGDLAASAIKRNHNIKDYGKIFPGHGGVMDRFDSMIVTAPMVYILTLMMVMNR